jgi:hypothetical protein
MLCDMPVYRHSIKYNKTIEYCEHNNAKLKRSANIYLINTNNDYLLPY